MIRMVATLRAGLSSCARCPHPNLPQAYTAEIPQNSTPFHMAALCPRAAGAKLAAGKGQTVMKNALNVGLSTSSPSFAEL